MDWIIPPGEDPLNYDSFVYIITNPTTGQWYLGKKRLWVRKAGKIHHESDWRNYWGTSKIMDSQYALTGKSNWTRTIIHLCVSSGHASWLELVELVKRDALTNPLSLNGNILMTFNHRVVSGYEDADRRAKYLASIARQKKAAGLDEEKESAQIPQSSARRQPTKSPS